MLKLRVSLFLGVICSQFVTYNAHALKAQSINVQILNTTQNTCQLASHNLKQGRLEYTSSIIPEYIPAYTLTSPIIVESAMDLDLDYTCGENNEVVLNIKGSFDFYSRHRLNVDILSATNMTATYQIDNSDSINPRLLLRFT